MNDQVSDWLPIEVASRREVRETFDRAIVDWSAKWFAGRSVRVASYDATPRGGAAQGRLDWRVYRGGIALAVARAGRLASWALDADLDLAGPTAADGELLDAVEQELLLDLIGEVETALGVDAEVSHSGCMIESPFGKLGGVVIVIADDRRANAVTLAAPFELILPACRRALSPSSRTPVRLTDLGTALTSAYVTVQADLGCARVTIDELRTLSVGDVLVLDTTLDGAVEITDPVSTEVLARAKIADEAGSVVLTLQP